MPLCHWVDGSRSALHGKSNCSPVQGLTYLHAQAMLTPPHWLAIYFTQSPMVTAAYPSAPLKPCWHSSMTLKARKWGQHICSKCDSNYLASDAVSNPQKTRFQDWIGCSEGEIWIIQYSVEVWSKFNRAETGLCKDGYERPPSVPRKDDFIR
jgi:hypothetical protein